MGIAGLWRGTVGSYARPFDRDMPGAIRDELVHVQHDRLRALLPMMCLAVVLTCLAATLALHGDLPWWRQFVPPAILVGACGFLVWRWSRDRESVPLATARTRLDRAPFLSGALGLVAGLWSVSAFSETEMYYCVVAPVFVTLSVLMAANCLASAPNAAVTAVVASFLPIVIKMLAFDNLGIRCIAVMMVVMAAMQLHLIYAKFDETVRTISLGHELKTLADTDPLTGLQNRRAFDASLTRLLARADYRVAVAMIDLDGFKPANDRYGHAAGDAVLVEVGKRLHGLFPQSPAIARIGGDEFALVLPKATTGATEANAVRAALGLPFAVGDDVITISAGVGVAQTPKDGTSVPELMRAADRALYTDKARRGRRTRANVSAA